MPETDLYSILFTNIWGLICLITLFGGSIFVHELGHFLAAKWRGLKIEEFSIGFGPRLFGWTDKEGIDYRVSLLPLGGYVKLPQLADLRAIEGDSDSPTRNLPSISYSDKMIVSVAGAVFNIVFAFALALIVWQVGHPSSEGAQSRTIGYVSNTLHLDEKTIVKSPAAKAGLQPGDVVLAFDGKPVENFSDLTEKIITGSGRDSYGNPKADLLIERNGQQMSIIIHPQLILTDSKSKRQRRMVGISPSEKTVIAEIIPFSPAAKTNLQPGDEILSMDGTINYSPRIFIDYASAHAGESITLDVRRKLPDNTYQTIKVDYTPILLPQKKPLFEMSYNETGSSHQITFLPHYSKDDLEALDSPTTKSRITVFELPDYQYAAQGHLRVGDTIVSVNGETISSLKKLSDVIHKSATSTLAFEIMRGEQKRAFSINIKEPDSYKIIPAVEGIAPGFLRKPNMVIVEPNPIEQFNEKINTTFTVLGSLLNHQSDVGVKNLSGPIGISRVLHRFSIEDLRLALMFTVLLNINLAILNLLPIPVLDGGHMLFATIAKLRGKQLPVNLVAGTQGAFMFMLLGLMMYIIFYDTLEWMGDHDYKQKQIQNRAFYLETVYPEPKSSELKTEDHEDH